MKYVFWKIPGYGILVLHQCQSTSVKLPKCFIVINSRKYDASSQNVTRRWFMVYALFIRICMISELFLASHIFLWLFVCCVLLQWYFTLFFVVFFYLYCAMLITSHWIFFIFMISLESMWINVPKVHCTSQAQKTIINIENHAFHTKILYYCIENT